MLNWIVWNRTELFEIEQFICIKMDLTLNNLQWLRYHKTKPNETKVNLLITGNADWDKQSKIGRWHQDKPHKN